MQTILLKIRRGDTPAYRFAKNLAKRLYSSSLPVPGVLRPVGRALFEFRHIAEMTLRWLFSYFYLQPLFRCRCTSVGKRFRLWRLPFVVGQTDIHIGDDVNFFGQVDIFSGKMYQSPRLIIGNRVDLGHGIVFVVNQEIIIEDDVNIASGVRFMDSDSHPRDTAERIADLGPRLDEIKPVKVSRYAWIGQNSFILKGVTIGEGAVVGVNSVVVSDIPAYAVAMGNPARVIVKNASKPVTPAVSGTPAQAH